MTQKAKLDELARRFTFARDDFRCRRCQKKKSTLQWCHVYSRRYLCVRWDPDNMLTLCAGCHLWWHHQPLEAAEWFANHVGPKVVERLRLVMKTPRRPDLAAVALDLEKRLAGFWTRPSGPEQPDSTMPR